MADRFCHRLAIARIRDGERLELVADAEERRAIAERLGFASLDSFEADLTLERDGPRIRARGRLRAALQQPCVATGEPVHETLDELFDLVFSPEPATTSPDEEIELGKDDCDTIFYEHGTIDLGSAVADTLALAVNPYPRSQGADAALRNAGVIGEEQAGPFAALAQLRKGRDGP